MERLAIEKDKVRAFFGLLDFLRRDYSDWTKQPKRSKLQRLNKKVTESTPFKVINSPLLRSVGETVVRTKERFGLDHSELLFLRPPSKEVLLPILSLNGDFKKSELRVQMALFTFDGFDEEANPVAIGFRFETPERKGAKHTYHHVQMIRSFHPPERPGVPLGLPAELRGLPPWFPDRLPAIPISAKTPISLLLGVLVGLYGLDYLVREWKDQPFFEDLKEGFEELKSGCGYC